MLYTHNGRVVIELKREPIQKTMTLSIIKKILVTTELRRCSGPSISAKSAADSRS